jgi:hypothetical protein
MRVSAGTIANALAWAVLIGLVPVVIVMVMILGPFGLVILGLITLFICTSLALNDEVPIRNAEIFRTRFDRAASPESRAALHEEKRIRLAPLRFYRWCGVGLIAAGLAGFAWQQF